MVEHNRDRVNVSENLGKGSCLACLTINYAPAWISLIYWPLRTSILYVAQGLQSVEAFIWHLGLLLSGSQLSDNSRNKFVLVLEAVRGCRCYTPTLLQAEQPCEAIIGQPTGKSVLSHESWGCSKLFNAYWKWELFLLSMQALSTLRMLIKH